MASASNSQRIYAPASSTYGYVLAVSFNETGTNTANNTSDLSFSASLTSDRINFSTNTNHTMTIFWHDDKDNTETPSIVIGDDKKCTSFPCQAKLVATSGSTVNFRKSNSKSSTILARIKLGTIVTVTGESNGWCSVTYNNMNGYIMSEFLVKA